MLVLANGYQAKAFSQLAWLPVEKVRGQVHRVRSDPQITNLQCVMCYDGFLIPEQQGTHFVGATYDHDNDSRQFDRLQAEQLTNRLNQWAPQVDTKQLQICEGRVAFRTMSPDRLPIIGPVPRLEDFREAYQAANNGQYGPHFPVDAALPDLFVSVGHGSRGLLSCLLGAELIASQVEDQPLPIEADLVRAVDPCRFLVRAVKRGQVDSDS